MRKGVVILLLALFLSFSIFAEEQSTIGDIVYSDIPISYGEAQFRERILERTNGERDPIGLVLTGGSARAFAHLGVLKYLEEEGVEPDYIVSNSMGSIIGMLYAAGLNHFSTKLSNAWFGCVSWLSTNVTALFGFSFTKVCSNICDKL